MDVQNCIYCIFRAATGVRLWVAFVVCSHGFKRKAKRKRLVKRSVSLLCLCAVFWWKFAKIWKALWNLFDLPGPCRFGFVYNMFFWYILIEPLDIFVIRYPNESKWWGSVPGWRLVVNRKGAKIKMILYIICVYAFLIFYSLKFNLFFAFAGTDSTRVWANRSKPFRTFRTLWINHCSELTGAEMRKSELQPPSVSWWSVCTQRPKQSKAALPSTWSVVCSKVIS